jgi:hypothetical protein
MGLVLPFERGLSYNLPMSVIHPKTPSPDLNISAGLPDAERIRNLKFEFYRVWEGYNWKRDLPEAYPLIVSLIGGTGTGKSAIFNSLARKALSKTSAIRPCTQAPVALAPEEWADLFVQCPVLRMGLGKAASREICEPPMEVIKAEQAESWDLLLVDTPDYDSVELKNAALAGNVFIISDIVILVTSKDKYADMASAQMNQWAKGWNKKTTRVINMVQDETVADDYIEKTGAEPVILHYVHGAPEMLDQIAKAQDPWAILGVPNEWDKRREIRAREIENIKISANKALNDLIRPLEAHQEKIETLCGEINRLVEVTALEMFEVVDKVFDKDLESRAKIQLTRALRRYDFLYGPRKKVSDLVGSALGKVTLGLWGWNESAGERKREEVEADLKRSWTKAHEESVMRAIVRFNHKIAELLAGAQGLSYLKDVASREVKMLDESDIRDHMSGVMLQVDSVLKEELEKFEKGLSTKEEITLYGSYTVSAMALLTAEVALGGGFGAVDVVLTGVVAPFIPKLALSAKVIDLLRELGKRVDGVYRDGLRGALLIQARLYEEAFLALSPGKENLDRLRELSDELSQ